MCPTVPIIRCATRLAVCFVFSCQLTDESQYTVHWCALMTMMTIYEKTSLPNRVVYLLLIFVQNNIVFVFFWKIYTIVFFSFPLALCVFCFLFTIVHFTKKFFFFFCSMYARVCVCQAVRLKNINLNLDKSI